MMNVYVSPSIAERTFARSHSYWLALATFAIAWITVIPGFGKAQLPEGTEREKGMWVMVRYLDGDKRAFQYGFVEKSQYQTLLSGDAKGFIKLDHVFWEKDDGFYYQEQLSEVGRFTQLRAGVIYEVVPLKDEYVKKAFSKEERDRASKRPEKKPTKVPERKEEPKVGRSSS